MAPGTQPRGAEYEEHRGRALLKLRALAHGIDPETAHRDADEALLVLLDDPEIREAFEAVPRGFGTGGVRPAGVEEMH